MAVVAALAGIAIPAQAAGEWRRADTHNFIIYSDGASRQLEDFASKIERFDALLRILFGVPATERPNRLTIYMLSSAKNVARLVDDRNVAGFYRPSREGSFAVTNRQRTNTDLELSGETVLFHEYAHHFMFRHFTFAYPAWYVEGYAEYVATAEFEKSGEWSYGRPAQHRATTLFYGDRISVDRVLFGDPSQMQSDERAAFYARSWLLVHYLNSDAEGRAKLAEYLKAVGGGETAEAAAGRTFDDLKALDRALDRYQDSRMSYAKSDRPIPYRDTIAVVQLDEVASQLAELSLVRRIGRERAETRDALLELAQAAPGRASVWYELALAERDLAFDADEPDLASAEAAVDRALALDPEHGRANVLKAELMMQRLDDEGIDETEPWREVRNYISIANQQDTEDPLPLLAYFDSYVHQRRLPPAVVHDALAKAFSLVPEATNVRMRYAFDLAAQERFDEALRLVSFLANDPHDPETGRSLVERIEAMRDARADNPIRVEPIEDVEPDEGGQ